MLMGIVSVSQSQGALMASRHSAHDASESSSMTSGAGTGECGSSKKSTGIGSGIWIWGGFCTK